MYIIVNDHYSFYGLFANAMLVISDDNQCVNIRREDEISIKPTFTVNIANQCSSRDAMDIDLYEIEDEDRLVYFENKALRRIVDEKPELYDQEVVLTFNNKSKIHEKEVVEHLKSKIEYIKSFTVEYKDAFEVTKEESVGIIKEWTGMDFDPEDNSLTFVDENGKTVEVTMVKD